MGCTPAPTPLETFIWTPILVGGRFIIVLLFNSNRLTRIWVQSDKGDFGSLSGALRSEQRGHRISVPSQENCQETWTRADAPLRFETFISLQQTA